MRTHIEIDDALMAEALRATGLKSKHAVVELGLQTLLRQHQQGQARHMRGKLQRQGDLARMRQNT